MDTDATMAGSDALRMYSELADWFHLLTPPADYSADAAFVLARLREDVDGPLETLLELGSGGGNTASHLRAHLRLTLTDVARPMLDLSRLLNPECEHLEGDMRTLRLGRTFDAVFIHDAVMYMASRDDLRAALLTAFLHCRPGGAAVFVPDCVRETLHVPVTSHGGSDGADRSLRYLGWTWDPDPTDTTYVTDFAILLREGSGVPRVRLDRHVMGVFPQAEWHRLLADVGFVARAVEDAEKRVAFVGRRPAA